MSTTPSPTSKFGAFGPGAFTVTGAGTVHLPDPRVAEQHADPLLLLPMNCASACGRTTGCLFTEAVMHGVPRCRLCFSPTGRPRRRFRPSRGWWREADPVPAPEQTQAIVDQMNRVQDLADLHGG